MSTVQLSDFQIELFSTLHGDAPLTAIVPVASSNNHMPQDEPLPYIYAHLSNAADWSCKDLVGFEVDVVLDVWTENHGDLQLLQIQALLMTLLNRNTFTLPTGQNVLLQHSASFFLREDDQTHHLSATFRALLTNTA